MNTNPKLLIVDDSKDNRFLLKKILEKNGYKNILLAESAKAAFNCLGINGSKSESENIDLILMDVIMPGIDGIEACRKIKKIKSLTDIPIIMVTAKKETETLQKAFDMGAIDYITKPINKIELLARIRSILLLKKEMDRRKELLIELEKANLTLKKLSSVDGLTGIANRRIFDDFFDKEWRRALRYQKPLSLIMVDVDFFKKYNDSYGHLAGDDCLKKVAKTLANVFKRPGDLVARYGGEEFAVILPETSSLSAAKLSEKARSRVEALKIPHKTSKTSKHVTISIGSATITPQKNQTVEELIKAADKMLYRSKETGRNKVCKADVL